MVLLVLLILLVLLLFLLHIDLFLILLSSLDLLAHPLPLIRLADLLIAGAFLAVLEADLVALSALALSVVGADLCAAGASDADLLLVRRPLIAFRSILLPTGATSLDLLAYLLRDGCRDYLLFLDLLLVLVPPPAALAPDVRALLLLILLLLGVYLFRDRRLSGSVIRGILLLNLLAVFLVVPLGAGLRILSTNLCGLVYIFVCKAFRFPVCAHLLVLFALLTPLQADIRVSRTLVIILSAYLLLIAVLLLGNGIIPGLGTLHGRYQAQDDREYETDCRLFDHVYE